MIVNFDGFTYQSFCNGFLFLFLGSGPSWILSNALFQETPYYQNNLPEGLCISSRLVVCANAGLIVSLIYYLVNRYCIAIPNEYAIAFIIVFVSLVAMLSAFFYSVTYDNLSMMLYIFMFFAGCVGNLMYQTLYPFLIKYEEGYMTAARTGSDAANAIVAFIVLAQSPGSSKPLFSPKDFFIGISVYVIAIPLISLVIILNYDIGVKRDERALIKKKKTDDVFDEVIEVIQLYIYIYYIIN